MSINHRDQATDGFGDRPDIALANDIAEGQIRENLAKQEFEKHKAILDASAYGTASNARNISDIVSEMIEEGCYDKPVLKSQIIWDVETLSEAVNLACIKLALSDEDFAPSINDNGFSINLRLV